MALGALLKVKMDSSAVSRGLRSIRAGFGALGSALGRLRGVWGKMKGAGLAGVFGAVAAQVQNTVRWMQVLQDEMENTSTKAKDILQIRSALQISGLDANQASQTLTEFQKRLGEARRGTGEAVMGLEELDLHIRDIADMPAAGAFKTIMQAVQNSKKPANLLIMALDKLFGGEGQKMFGLAKNFAKRMEMGADATEALADGFDRLGEGEGLRELQARFAQFRNSMRLFWMEFVQKLPLGAVAKMLTTIAERAPQIIEGITKFFEDPMGEGSFLKAITDWFEEMLTKLMGFFYQWGEELKITMAPALKVLGVDVSSDKYKGLIPDPKEGISGGHLDKEILDEQKKQNKHLMDLSRRKAVWA